MNNSNDKPNLPLPLFWKIMVFVLPIGFLSGGFFFIPNKVYERSREETWALAIWGAITWTMIILILIGLKAITP